jgi:hypothetical protein
VTPEQAEYATLSCELGAGVVAVCTTHRRFIPCRGGERAACYISEDPVDIARVEAYQRWDEDGWPVR